MDFKEIEVFNISVIYDQWPKLHLGLDVELSRKIINLEGSILASDMA